MTIKKKREIYTTTICTWNVQAQSRLALKVVVGRAASSAASAASPTAASPTATASEVGEPPPSVEEPPHPTDFHPKDDECFSPIIQQWNNQ
jgi:hypothetical protein